MVSRPTQGEPARGLIMTLSNPIERQSTPAPWTAPPFLITPIRWLAHGSDRAPRHGDPGKVHFGSPGFGTGMVANLQHDHRVAVLEERVAALEKRVGLVAAQDRINLRSPVDDSKISEVIR
jgi:hypothetical protein